MLSWVKHDKKLYNLEARPHSKIDRDTAFSPRLHMRTAKTQICLRTLAVWSVFTGHSVGSQESKASWGG